MNSTRINIIAIVGVASIVALMLSQYFWASKVQNLEEIHFNNKVKIALSNVGNKLELMNKSTISKIHPIEQIEYNKFIVKINDIVQPQLLDTLLKYEFAEGGIDLTYTIAIYDCFTDSVVYTSSTENLKFASANDYQLNWDIDSYNFGVIFPDREKVFGHINVWLIATIVPIIVSILFFLTLYIVFRQKKLDEMKTDFINNMTHELKTPISTISLSSEVLMKPTIAEQPERLSKYAHIIYSENQRLKSQVEKVLQMALFENKKLEIAHHPEDIHEIISSAIERFELTIQSNIGKIETDFKANKSIVIGDNIHLLNIVSNIIDNGIKYCVDPPHITISTRNEKSNIVIEIKDNGIGMSPSELKNVFSKFYRVPTGNVHDVKGFGLGLNYVKIMTEAHKGTVEVKSSTGAGTTFTIKLPLKDE